MIRNNSWKNIQLNSESDGGGGASTPTAPTTSSPSNPTTSGSPSSSAPAASKPAPSSAPSSPTTDQQKIQSALERIKAASPEIPKGTPKAPGQTGQAVKPLISHKPSEELLTGEFGGEVDESGFTEEPTPVVKKPENKDVVAKQPENKQVQAEVKPVENGVDKEDEPFLKKMSKEASAHFLSKQAKLKSELEVLKQKVEASKRPYPENYLEHPEAYSLLPEYGENVQKLNQADMEYRHWYNQLVRIEEGKDWQDIKGLDENGNLVLSDPNKASTRDKIAVQAQLQKLVGLKNQFKGDVEKLQSTFNAEREKQNGLVVGEVNRMFEWETKPELLKAELDFGGTIGKRNVEQLRNEFVQMMPPVFRNNLVTTKVAANMYAAIQLYAFELNKLKSENAKLKQAGSDNLRAEPSSDILAGKSDKSVGKITEFSMEGIN